MTSRGPCRTHREERSQINVADGPEHWSSQDMPSYGHTHSSTGGHLVRETLLKQGTVTQREARY